MSARIRRLSLSGIFAAAAVAALACAGPQGLAAQAGDAQAAHTARPNVPGTAIAEDLGWG